MNMITMKINGTDYSVPAGLTVLEACKYARIDIPTICYLKDINEIGACRMCVVEVKGAKSFVASCVYPATDGMEVITNSTALRKARKTTLELILSNHERKCLSCPRSQSCELQRLAMEYGVDDEKYAGNYDDRFPIDTSPYVIRDNNKCILCRRCVATCRNVQSVGAIGMIERGFATHIGSAFEKDLGDVACAGCGQCIVSCPVGALTEPDDTEKVWEAISDPKKKVYISIAPAIRATLGECFGMPIGTNVRGKTAAALRRCGFDGVYDLDVTADLTIMEEGTEFIDRLQNGGKLPLITSCSPGWIKFCEHFYPDLLDNLSSCKSPQQMFGAMLKTYYAKKEGIDPKDIFYVSVIPCTAKKFEITREHQAAAGVPDVDIALTTRELGRLIKKAGIQLPHLSDEEFDEPFGISTGAGTIFGVTGGVMEAALRTVAEVVLKKPLTKLDFTEVRGLEGIKEATYQMGDLKVNVAVASGLGNARKLMDLVRAGKANYHFIEIMACPGGCINGGGQPYQPDSVRNWRDVRVLRAKALYDEDQALGIRKSHANPVVQALYDEFLEKPGSHKAHEILHTKYVEREPF